jgi:hypothetical protein
VDRRGGHIWLPELSRGADCGRDGHEHVRSGDKYIYKHADNDEHSDRADINQHGKHTYKHADAYVHGNNSADCYDINEPVAFSINNCSF